MTSGEKTYGRTQCQIGSVSHTKPHIYPHQPTHRPSELPGRQTCTTLELPGTAQTPPKPHTRHNIGHHHGRTKPRHRQNGLNESRRGTSGRRHSYFYLRIIHNTAKLQPPKPF